MSTSDILAWESLAQKNNLDVSPSLSVDIKGNFGPDGF